MAHRFALAILVFVGLFASSAGPASAQNRPSIDARTWRPSTDPNASLVTEPVGTPGPGAFDFGAYGSYSLRPLALRKAGSDDIALRPVQHVVGLDAVAALGIGQRFSIGALVPLILYQDGSSGLPDTVSQTGSVPKSAIGDVALTMKGTLKSNDGGGLGIAALGNVSLPTGDRASFYGDGSVTASVRVLAEYTLLIASVQASLGYKLRTDRHTWPAAEAGGYRFGDEIPWTFGITMKPGVLGIDSGNRQRLEVALHGWLPAGPVGPFGSGDPGSAALSPVMITASDRIEIGHYRDVFLTIGADFGLNEAVGVPIVRGIVGLGWAPREHDLDHDGVKDDVDGCPEIAEDRDGFEDADGCPEIDNDDDGIPDKQDACPNEKGTESTDPSKNGCPDKGAAAPAAGDRDHDGIPDPKDRCPDQVEDKDGFQDEDGCPDPDNDHDGIPDTEDACPNQAGDPSSDPARNGCPNKDPDGDTIEGAADKCPNEAETWNGVDDEDGCPDQGGKPLATVDEKAGVKVANAVKITGAGELAVVDAASMNTIRALATAMHGHPNWTLAVGVRPVNGDSLEALAKAFAVVRALGDVSKKDGIAETVGFDAVQSKADASGVGFLILTTPVAPIGKSSP